jgi:Protein of unknown function (DUF3810)
VAAIAALVHVPASIVERLYARRIYAGLQPLVTSISNLVSFPLFDLLAALVVVAYVSLAVRDLVRIRGRWRALWSIVARTAVWSAAIYLLFLAMWGLNYRRVRLADALRFDESRVTPAAAGDAARTAVDHLNALYDRAHVDGWPDASAVDPVLSEALDRAAAEIGRPHAVVPGRPKRSLVDWWFRRAGVDGMTDPFFLETLIVGDLLPFERPFVVAHEWSHLAGVGDEGEANFLGWLACMRAAPPAQYSGWLFLYPELVRSMPPHDRAALGATLRPGPRADLEAMRERTARDVSPRMSAVGWRVYDSYLKANRVEAGVASYTEVTRLVLGARLVSGKAPLSE